MNRVGHAVVDVDRLSDDGLKVNDSGERERGVHDTWQGQRNVFANSGMFTSDYLQVHDATKGRNVRGIEG